jgi:N-acetylneuraminic acid mutarotase
MSINYGDKIPTGSNFETIVAYLQVLNNKVKELRNELKTTLNSNNVDTSKATRLEQLIDLVDLEFKRIKQKLIDLLNNKGVDISGDVTLDDLISSINKKCYTLPEWCIWVDVEKPLYARDDPTIEAVGDCIYMFGGSYSYDGYVRNIDVYNTKTNEWDNVAYFNSMMSAMGCTTSGTNIYLIGGADANSDSTTYNRIFDTTTNTLSDKRDLPYSACSLTANNIDNKIYCVGGWDNKGTTKRLNNNYCYDIKLNTWTAKAPIPTIVEKHSAEVVDGKLYCIGGFVGNNYLSTNYCYDPITNTWTTKAAYPSKVANFASFVFNKKIYCTGGFVSTDGAVSTGYTNKTYCYDPATNTWNPKTSLPVDGGVDGIQGVVVNGIGYVIGGYPLIDAWYYTYNFMYLIED